MLEAVETVLEQSLIYHQSRALENSSDIKLLTPILSLVISRATMQTSDECSSSSIMAEVDGIIGSDEVEEVEQEQLAQRIPHTSAGSGPIDISESAEHLITSAVALSRVIYGHEETITSVKDLDVKVSNKANDVLNSLWLGGCERIERYLQGLAIVQRSAGLIASNEQELSVCEAEIRNMVEVNALKLESIPFLRTAKPVV